MKNAIPTNINKIPINISIIDVWVTILHNENPLKIAASPNVIKHAPAIIDTVAALTNGKAIKSTPNNINRIPSIFAVSIFSPKSIFI